MTQSSFRQSCVRIPRLTQRSAPGEGDQRQQRLGQNNLLSQISFAPGLTHFTPSLRMLCCPFTHLFQLCLAHTLLKSVSVQTAACPIRIPAIILLCAHRLPHCITLLLLILPNPTVYFLRAKTVCCHHCIPSWLLRCLECGIITENVE